MSQSDTTALPRRLLLVDDDDVSREILDMLATAAGYEVQTAESGDAALALLHSGACADAILTDLQMPGTSGEALAHALRAACAPGTPILAMSASGNGHPAYDGFLRKPFEMAALTTLVEGRPAAAPSLNEQVLDRLIAAMGKSQSQVLYTMCLDDAVRRVAHMQRAADAQDNATFVREAHAIRGGTGLVGATEINLLAAAMEETGLTPGPESVNTSLARFLAACDRLQRILDAHT